MTPHELFFTSLGAILTGVITITILFLKHYFISDSKKFDESSQIRSELRSRCSQLEARIDALTMDNEKWRVRYFSETQKLSEINMTLKHDIAALNAQLQDVKERFIPKKYKDAYSS